jgi:hypothetical protein
MSKGLVAPISDGGITIRPPGDGDHAALVGARDAEARRWLGEASEDWRPTGCIVVEGQVVGWVDYDADREWLRPDQVNVGYQIFPGHRGRGYATRGVLLLIEYLAGRTSYREHFAKAAVLHPADTVTSSPALSAKFSSRETHPTAAVVAPDEAPLAPIRLRSRRASTIRPRSQRGVSAGHGQQVRCGRIRKHAERNSFRSAARVTLPFRNRGLQRGRSSRSCSSRDRTLRKGALWAPDCLAAARTAPMVVFLTPLWALRRPRSRVVLRH